MWGNCDVITIHRHYNSIAKQKCSTSSPTIQLHFPLAHPYFFSLNRWHPQINNVVLLSTTTNLVLLIFSIFQEEMMLSLCSALWHCGRLRSSEGEHAACEVPLSRLESGADGYVQQNKVKNLSYHFLCPLQPDMTNTALGFTLSATPPPTQTQ